MKYFDKRHKKIMMEIASAIVQNNEGINFLERGLHKHALFKFQEAARILYQVTKRIKKNVDGGNPEMQPRIESRTVCWISEKSILKENLFIRSKPIFMKAPSDSMETSHCTLESATVLLNMAMTYHIDSQIPNCIEDALNNAIKLYEMAYSLGLKLQADDRSNQIILTVLNNLGQIYFEIGEYSRSRLYFEDLNMYVSVLRPLGHDDIFCDRKECMLNALVLLNPYRSAPAA
jgi:tetratricopeptide (TPR) repeat protein